MLFRSVGRDIDDPVERVPLGIEHVEPCEDPSQVPVGRVEKPHVRCYFTVAGNSRFVAATVPAGWLDAAALWGGWMGAVLAFALVVVLAIHQLRMVASKSHRDETIDRVRQVLGISRSLTIRQTTRPALRYCCGLVSFVM